MWALPDVHGGTIARVLRQLHKFTSLEPATITAVSFRSVEPHMYADLAQTQFLHTLE